MKDRRHAFGAQTYSLLDNVIFFLRAHQVLRRVPPLSGKTIADFGSGYDCRLLRRLLGNDMSIQGIAVDMDFQESLVDVMNIRLCRNDLNEASTIPSESIDVCISLAVLEHLDKPQFFLTELYRVLKIGGTAVLTTPGPASKPLLEFLAYRLNVIDPHEIEDHKNYFSSSSLKRMFIVAGFLEEHINAKTFIWGMNNVVTAIK